MTAIATVPAADEYAHRTTAATSAAFLRGDIVAQLKRQIRDTVALLRPLDATRARYRYAPDKWSVIEIVGHLADGERIFSYRALRFARDDQSPLPGFDENTYVPAAECDRRALADVLAEFEAVRAATVDAVRGPPAGAWTRVGVASGHRMIGPGRGARHRRARAASRRGPEDALRGGHRRVSHPAPSGPNPAGPPALSARSSAGPSPPTSTRISCAFSIGHLRPGARAAPLPASRPDRRSDRHWRRDILKELVEINTSDSAGHTPESAQAIGTAARRRRHPGQRHPRPGLRASAPEPRRPVPRAPRRR